MRRVGARPRGRDIIGKQGGTSSKKACISSPPPPPSPVSAHPTHLVLSPSSPSSTITPIVSTSSAGAVLAGVVALVVVPERISVPPPAPIPAHKRENRTTPIYLVRGKARRRYVRGHSAFRAS
jgi:hypothetical protein